MTRIRIGIPWLDSGDEHRARSFRYVFDHVAQVGEVFAGAACIGKPWARATARNSLATNGCVILHDADMVAPLDAYPAMAELALTSGRMVVGFHQYRALDQMTTETVLDGADPFDMPAIGTTDGWSVGGIIAITPDAWAEVGGMDERFHGWGCEDFAFAHAAALVLGPPLRIDTPAVHLWHPHGNVAGDPQIEANSRLMARYIACTTIDELREVQRD